MSEEQLIEGQRGADTVHYMIRGHGAMTGQITNINPEGINTTMVTTYTAVGDWLSAATPATDIAVCNLSAKDYNGKPFNKNDYVGLFPDMEICCWNDDDDVNHPAGLYMCVPGRQGGYPYVLIEQLTPVVYESQELSEYILQIYAFHKQKKFKGKIRIHLLACLGYESGEFISIGHSYMLAEKYKQDALRLQPILNVTGEKSKIQEIKHQINELLKKYQYMMDVANNQSYTALKKTLNVLATKDSVNPLGLSQDQKQFEMAAAAAKYIEGQKIETDIETKEKELHEQHQRFADEQRQRLGQLLIMLDQSDPTQGGGAVGGGAVRGGGSAWGQPSVGSLPNLLPSPPPPTGGAPFLVPLPPGIDQPTGPAGAWGGRGGKKKRTTKKTRKRKQKKRRKSIRKRKRRTIRRKKRGGYFFNRAKHAHTLKKKQQRNDAEKMKQKEWDRLWADTEERWGPRGRYGQHHWQPVVTGTKPFLG